MMTLSDPYDLRVIGEVAVPLLVICILVVGE